jgi:SAM-dependent methyltransferase
MVRRLPRALERYSKWHSRRHLYEWIEAAIAEHCRCQPSDILNVGAGGEVAEVLHRAGVAPISIDVDPNRAPDRVMNVEDMSAFREAEFDAVFLVEVLEHVRNPQRAIAEIARVLKPGGVLIGSTPFLLGIHDCPHDYYRFTRFGLLHLFSGLERLTLAERNDYFDAVYVLCLRVLNVGTRGQRFRALCLAPVLIMLRPVFWLLERLIRPKDGTTGYFFVFRKPLDTGRA